MSQHPASAKYPDTIALAFDECHHKLTCVYNDHSIYVWDVRDIRRVGKSHSFLFHSACIWGVEMYPTGSDSINGMPPGSFVTCSSDDTIRVWNLEKDLLPDDTMYRRNIYSNVSYQKKIDVKFIQSFFIFWLLPFFLFSLYSVIDSFISAFFLFISGTAKGLIHRSRTDLFERSGLGCSRICGEERRLLRRKKRC